MKVMVVCTTGGSGRRQFGGAERLLVDLLPALRRAGIEVVAYTADDMLGGACRTAGVPWVELAARRRVDPAYVRGIRGAVAQAKPDVVNAHLLSAAMHARAALSVAGRDIPLVVALHNSLWQYRQSAASVRQRAAAQVNILIDLAMRRIRPHTSVAVSEYEAAELRVRAKATDVRVIANALPASWPEPGRTGPPPAGGPRVGRPRVGFLGRLEPEKGADLLGEIARAAPAVDLLVGGTGAVSLPELANLRTLGHVPAAEFLAELDCLVVPSRVESFGLSALEALSLGVPVVHSGAGGLGELTRRADGVLAYQTDLAPAAIAAAIQKATCPGPSGEQRLETARWYQQRYGFGRLVEDWVDLNRSVVDGRRRRHNA
jgi:glycosyltransferase involved in cell wall biosynthesis